jgi:solute carrier family 25 carnitine/acylcarnitine transporter 20/29
MTLEPLLTEHHAVRDTIGTAIYFGTYETVKQILSNGRGNGPAEPGAVALAGATCGIVSWVMVRIIADCVILLLIKVQIYPIDVVKTQFQKRQLETGRAQVSRPDIKFFQPGSYRGKPI